MAHPGPQFRVVEQGVERPCERSRVAGWHEEPGHALLDDVREAANARRDNRPSDEHALDGYPAHRLMPDRWHDRDTRTLQRRHRLRVRHVPDRDDIRLAKRRRVQPWGAE